jgi:hypothetical protein
MTRTIPTLATGSEFDEFLYASIGVEDNGMLLSVLSALARLNLDPWDEASRLARLPRDAATRFLANLIAAQPDGSSARTDPELHAKRLAALLPHAVTSSNSRPSKPISTGVTSARPILIRYVLYYIALAIFVYGAAWLMERSRLAAPSGTSASPTAGAQLPPTPAPTPAPTAAPARP